MRREPSVERLYSRLSAGSNRSQACGGHLVYPWRGRIGNETSPARPGSSIRSSPHPGSPAGKGAPSGEVPPGSDPRVQNSSALQGCCCNGRYRHESASGPQVLRRQGGPPVAKAAARPEAAWPPADARKVSPNARSPGKRGGRALDPQSAGNVRFRVEPHASIRSRLGCHSTKKPIRYAFQGRSEGNLGGSALPFHTPHCQDHPLRRRRQRHGREAGGAPPCPGAWAPRSGSPDEERRPRSRGRRERRSRLGEALRRGNSARRGEHD